MTFCDNKPTDKGVVSLIHQRKSKVSNTFIVAMLLQCFYTNTVIILI